MSADNSVGATANALVYYDDPLFLSSSDQPISQLLPYQFNGEQFISWKRDVYFSLVAKNKEGFVDGSVKQPPKTDKKHNQWVRCDLMVRRWILNSLVKEIRETVEYLRSSKALWNELLERYGLTNGLEVYQLKKELGAISQENKPLIEYYSHLKRVWEHIDAVDPIPLCTCGAIEECSCQLLKRIMDRENNGKLIKFLMGLNNGYDNVRTNILSEEPLPAINKALSKLHTIERQKQINDAVDVLSEANAFAAKNVSDWKRPKLSHGQSSSSSDRVPKQCSYCNFKGHTRDECFRLKECSYCGKSGHVKETCHRFQYDNSQNGKGKGKPHFNRGSNVYRRAHNAEVLSEETPLDDYARYDGDNGEYYVTNAMQQGQSEKRVHPQPSTVNLDQASMDGLMQNVVQQVIKAFNVPSSGGLPNSVNYGKLSSVNFAGPFK